MKYRLVDVCEFNKEKIDVRLLSVDNYISTENMLPNKAGIERASSLPTTKQTQAFEEGDVLVSNIRPYFKKIWKAEFSGGCSNDVLVFRAKEGVEKEYLYYLLAEDAFFDYAMATSKGTKMPRGDKASIMQYQINLKDVNEQKRIASILNSIDRKIKINDELNNNLAA